MPAQIDVMFHYFDYSDCPGSRTEEDDVRRIAPPLIFAFLFGVATSAAVIVCVLIDEPSPVQKTSPVLAPVDSQLEMSSTK